MYTQADKYEQLILSFYKFKPYSTGKIEWGWSSNQGYSWGGLCENMKEAISQAFEHWEEGQ